jgi:IclR family mhp operon transcriptional activator
MRGLDALTVLNMRDGATVSEVAQDSSAAHHRLSNPGNAVRCRFRLRDGSDDRHRLTIQVRALSDGFERRSVVTQIAKPIIHELCREVIWPISVATLSGTSMLVRECTDHQSSGDRTSFGRISRTTAHDGERPAFLAYSSGRSANR